MNADKYEGPERRGWHVKKEISLGDLVAILLAFAAAFAAYYSLDKRISLIEQSVVYQAKESEKKDADLIRYQQRMEAALQQINEKLDRLMRRGN